MQQALLCRGTAYFLAGICLFLTASHNAISLAGLTPRVCDFVYRSLLLLQLFLDAPFRRAHIRLQKKWPCKTRYSGLGITLLFPPLTENLIKMCWTSLAGGYKGLLREEKGFLCVNSWFTTGCSGDTIALRKRKEVGEQRDGWKRTFEDILNYSCLFSSAKC